MCFKIYFGVSNDVRRREIKLLLFLKVNILLIRNSIENVTSKIIAIALYITFMVINHGGACSHGNLVILQFGNYGFIVSNTSTEYIGYNLQSCVT